MPCAACGTGVPCVATDTLSGWVKIQDSLVPHVAWGAWSTKWCGERWFFLCDDCGLATYSKDHSNDWFWKWYRRHMGTWIFFKSKWQAKYGRNFKRRRMVEWWPTEAEPPATAAKVEPKVEPKEEPVAAEPALAEASGALQPPAEPTPAEASGALQHLAAAELTTMRIGGMRKPTRSSRIRLPSHRRHSLSRSWAKTEPSCGAAEGGAYTATDAREHNAPEFA